MRDVSILTMMVELLSNYWDVAVFGAVTGRFWDLTMQQTATLKAVRPSYRRLD